MAQDSLENVFENTDLQVRKLAKKTSQKNPTFFVLNFVGKITGVDISSGMLSQALKSKVYESVRLKDLDEDFGIEEKVRTKN